MKDCPPMCKDITQGMIAASAGNETLREGSVTPNDRGARPPSGQKLTKQTGIKLRRATRIAICSVRHASPFTDIPSARRARWILCVLYAQADPCR